MDVVAESLIDFAKLTKPAAIKMAIKVFLCTEEQAKEFIALLHGGSGDVIRGGTDEEESGAGRA